MVTAFVLIVAERDKIAETAEALTEIDGIAEVYSVAGQCDLVAVIRAKTNDQLADVVTERMLKMPSIESTQTLIAFQAYSKHDLERMFSIGMDDEK